MVASEEAGEWEPLRGEAGAWGPIEAVPAWIEPALGQVLRDLQRPQPVAVRIGWTPPASTVLGEEGLLWFQEVGDKPAMFGVTVPPRELERASHLAWLAERMQDEWFETAGAWGQARPPCPGHPHPAIAEERDSVALWVCPEHGTALWPIGQAP